MKTAQIDRETAQVHRFNEQADDALTEIRSGVYRAALLVRGFLLGMPPESGAPLPQELAAIHTATDQHMRDLDSLIGPEQLALVSPLRQELAGYWHSLDLILELNPDNARGPQQPLLKEKALHLEAILHVTDQIDTLNTANLRQQERELRDRRDEFAKFRYRSTALVLLLGMAIAVGCVMRLLSLERRSDAQKARAEGAESAMRRLSHQLVAAQEDERKALSRELHDEIGQMLTGLRIELGSLGRLHAPAADAFRERLESVKTLADETLRAVRNLAQDLRPPVLDDLGIGPALRSQTKKFSGRTGIAIALSIEGDVDSMPEPYRTCLYRIVQEALTNCARHAEAARIIVKLRADKSRVWVSIEDDGKGFDPRSPGTRGLGLIGMEERARELNGVLLVQSQTGRGATIRVELPLRMEAIVGEDSRSLGR